MLNIKEFLEEYGYISIDYDIMIIPSAIQVLDNIVYRPEIFSKKLELCYCKKFTENHPLKLKYASASLLKDMIQNKEFTLDELERSCILALQQIKLCYY